MDKKNIYLGIDFGTSSIKIAAWNFKRKEPDAIKLDKGSGDNKIKNVVYYQKDAPILWDTTAESKDDDGNKIFHIKRKFEKLDWKKYIPNIDKEKKAFEVFGDILKKIKTDIETSKANNQQVDKAVLSVPVHFSEYQKEKLIIEAKKNGINIDEVVLEPVAAAINYSLLKKDNGSMNIIIFDLGGGTLDLTLFNKKCVKDKVFVRILDSLNIFFGGIDIDKLIFNHIVIKNWTNVNYNSLDEQNKRRIKNIILPLITEAKENLFSDEDNESEDLIKSSIYNGQNIEINIRKDEIISLLEENGIRKNIEMILSHLLKESDLEKSDINEVKFVGGSSRIHYFQNIVSDFFENRDIFNSDDNDDIYTAVSFGACQHLANMLENNLSLTVKNKIPFSLGIKKPDKPDKIPEIIKKNADYEFFSPIQKLLDASDKVEKIEVYQFVKNLNNTKEVYIGDFIIDTSKYSESIFYRMGTNRRGEVVCRLFDNIDTELDNFDEEIKLSINLN